MNFQKLLAQSLIWRSLYFASTLLVNIALSRFLQAEGTGRLYYLLSIFQFVQLVTSFSLNSGITYYASGRIVPANKLLWLAVAWTFIVVIVVSLGTFTYQYNILHSPINAAAEICFFAVCYVWGIALTDNCSVLFYVQNDFRTSNIILVLFNVLLLFAVPFSTSLANKPDTHLVMRIYFLVFFFQGVALAVAYAIKNKSWGDFSFPSLKQSKQVLLYSIIAHSGNIIYFLGYRIDYWFVHINPAVCTDADLGNYIQVSKMGQLFLIVPQIIASVIFPKSASGGDRTELNNSLMVISRLLSQLFLFIFIITLLFGGRFFPWVFGPTFNKMQIPFVILVPGIFCLSVLALVAAYFSGKGILKVNVIGNVVALVVIVAGDYFLVPLYGIIGAAIVSTAGYFVNMLYSLLRFYKDYSISWADFFKWRKQD
jgi:O-antigen/teichoic acid export membrane protein